MNETGTILSGENTQESVEVVPAESTQTGSEIQTQLSANSIECYSEDTKGQIINLANEVDVRAFDKVMEYGSSSVNKAYNFSKKVIQDNQSTSAEQEVLEMVKTLAKEAEDKYNLVIAEPNFFEKLIGKIFTGLKSDSNDVKVKAISCFNILQQYVKSCDKWLENLKKAEEYIMLSGKNKVNLCNEIEKYLVAGYIAVDRTRAEVEEAKREYEENAIIEYKREYEVLKDGLENFELVLLNLEKIRAATGLAVGELTLELNTNRRIQLAVKSQKTHSSAVMAQQLEIAYYDAVNKEALDGQKAITELNNRLVKTVAQRVKATGEEAERILTEGVYSIESAKQAAETVIEGYNSIKKASEENRAKITEQMDKLKAVVDELAPYVQNLKRVTNKDGDEDTDVSSSSEDSLVF